MKPLSRISGFPMCFAAVALLASLASAYANVYFGTEDRKYMKIHRAFISDIPADVRMATPKVSNASIRGYALENSRMICLYLVNRTDQTAAITGAVDTINPAFGQGEGFWMDPSTGDTLAKFSTGAGVQAIAVPSFTVDIAAKIFEGAIAVERRPASLAGHIQVRPNPFRPGTEILVSLVQSGACRFTIYRTDGRKIRDFGAQNLEAGSKAFFWDGRDDLHRAVAAGLYVAVLQGPGFRLNRTLQLLR